MKLLSFYDDSLSASSECTPFVHTLGNDNCILSSKTLFIKIRPRVWNLKMTLKIKVKSKWKKIKYCKTPCKHFKCVQLNLFIGLTSQTFCVQIK